MRGVARPWDIGLLYDRGRTAFATGLLRVLEQRPGLTVGNNEPYRMDETDYTVPRHAYPSGLAYVEIEIRQDHLAAPAGSERWCDILQSALTATQMA